MFTFHSCSVEMLSEPFTGIIGPEYAKFVSVVCVAWVLGEVPDVSVAILGAWPIPDERKATTPSRMTMRIEIASRECLKISIG